VVFPGYADLRTFSQEHEAMLKGQCGGAWQCYFQRGNWRVVFPFTRHQQEHMARKLEEELQQKGIAVAHLVRFPQLSINHAVLMYGAKADSTQVQFLTYDPNEPEKPTVVTFDRATRTFTLPTNAYFQGGRVDVYPIYDRVLY
jgi:DMSO/TMAO reductase YedYZ molybdopterin-dependent catalytic subunit